jgi:hypothetical protein
LQEYSGACESKKYLDKGLYNTNVSLVMTLDKWLQMNICLNLLLTTFLLEFILY